MREVYQVITALEATAAEMLAKLEPKLRKPALVALENANAVMKTSLARDDLNEWAKADDAFHRALFDGCNNHRLARIAYTILDQSHRARMLTLRLRKRPDGSAKEHLAIVSAIKSGDSVKASASARAHRQRAADELLPLLTHLGMRIL
jgi:DNA-binding GntR family transcriptional regulator